MGIKITSIKEAIEDNGLKILVHAPAGSGKTVLMATACEKTLIISAESGLLSLNNDSLKENEPHFMPELCDVVEVKTVGDVEDVYNYLVDVTENLLTGEQIVTLKDHGYEWVMLDSISEIAEVVLANELENSKDPRQAYGELSARMNKTLRAFRDIPMMNVAMTCKQVPIKDDYSGLVVYSPSLPGAKLGQNIPYLFDEVFVLRIEKDEDGEDYRVLQTRRDIQFEAKDRSGKLAKFERPSLKSIYDKIHNEEKEVKAKKPVEKENKAESFDVSKFVEKLKKAELIDLIVCLGAKESVAKDLKVDELKDAIKEFEYEVVISAWDSIR